MRSVIVRWKDIADSTPPPGRVGIWSRRETLLAEKPGLKQHEAQVIFNTARDRQIADFISSKVRPLCFRMGGLDYFFNKAYATRAVR